MAHTVRRLLASLLALAAAIAIATSQGYDAAMRPVFVVPRAQSTRSYAARWGQQNAQGATTRTYDFELRSSLADREVGNVAKLVAFGLGLSILASRLRASKCGRAGSSNRPTVVPRKVADTAVVARPLLDEEPTKPTNDPRSYKLLELQNGLQVLLASDPTASFGAAALTVRCGTFQDPMERLGLAHFHEHMLFLGTEKYPSEEEYSKYLNDHGGDSNAFTMNEYTTYYFKVASPFLEGALDRFAQFFVCPTFDPSCVEREMNAVDSESTNYSTEDGWRLQQVLKATADSGHPFFRFDVGNLSTLGAEDPSKTRAELLEWNLSHYQAGAMRLAIVGQDSLEDLESKTLDYFGPVRNGKGQELKYGSKAWPADRLKRIVYALPIKESRSVSVCWPLPPMTEQLYGKPEVYISHMLGHEGDGSLHNILNQLGWVDELSAGSSQDFSDGQLFAVNVVLTPEGDAHRDEVLGLLFKYVDMVRQAGPSEEVHKELVSLQEIAFAHQEDAPMPDNFAVSAAMSMHKYPPKDVFRGPYAIDEWKPDVVQEYMNTLTIENSLVFITSSSFKEEAEGPDAASKGWKNEEWYQCAFREEDITPEYLTRWDLKDVETGLRLPNPNPFIPQDFSLKGKAASDSGPETTKLPLEVTPPKVVMIDPMIRLWHKVDCAFKSPRAYVMAQIHTPAYDVSPLSVMMMRLFCSVVADDLNAYAYDAQCAGLSYGVSFSQSVSLSVGGFNDKLPELLQVVLQRIIDVLRVAEEVGQPESEEDLQNMPPRGREIFERMETQRQIMLQDYRNFPLEEPYSVGSYYAGVLMAPGMWVLDEYINELEKPASLKAMAAAVREAFKQIQFELLVHGNANIDEAKKACDAMVASFKELGTSEAMPEIKRRPVTMLPLGKATVFEFDLVVKNPAQENCCTQNIYQVGPAFEDIHRDACVAVVTHIAGTSAYQRLRTEEQLGYIVQGGAWSESHVIGMQVIVQGPRMPPHEVDVRIEEWIKSFGEELEKMSEEDFQVNVDAVVSERTQRFARLAQESGKHWNEIASRRYDFHRLQRGVEALRSLTKDDIVKLFGEYFAAGAPSRRKASIRVLGTSAQGAATPEGEGVILRSVEDIRNYQTSGECSTVLPPPPADIPASLLMASS